MFNKFVNTIMSVFFIIVADVSFGDIFTTGNSLFFFGEPEYPIEK